MNILSEVVKGASQQFGREFENFKVIMSCTQELK